MKKRTLCALLSLLLTVGLLGQPLAVCVNAAQPTTYAAFQAQISDLPGAEQIAAMSEQERSALLTSLDTLASDLTQALGGQAISQSQYEALSEAIEAVREAVSLSSSWDTTSVDILRARIAAFPTAQAVASMSDAEKEALQEAMLDARNALDAAYDAHTISLQEYESLAQNFLALNAVFSGAAPATTPTPDTNAGTPSGNSGVMPLASEPTVWEVGTKEEYEAAVAGIRAASGGDHEIHLTNNLESIGGLTLNTGADTVTIYGHGYRIGLNNNGSFEVYNNKILNLGSPDSDKAEASKLTVTRVDTNIPGMIYISGPGTVNMYDGVSLKDAKSNNYYGGGVTVRGGTFNMYGGTIDNCGIQGGSVCFGGGVAVTSGGLFNMSGGTIPNCYAESDYIDSNNVRCLTAMGGGVFCAGGSTFNMFGGAITNNRATNMGGGVMLAAMKDELSGSTMYGKLSSKVTISDGTIIGNTASNGAGLAASAYYYVNSLPLCAFPPANGLASNPGLYISGGTFKNNTASTNGGGILVTDFDTVTASISSATITENSASANGGGIALIGKATPSQPTVRGFTNSATVTNCTITGNKSSDYGAGVYYDSKSQLKISGANTVKDNTKNGALNNLNILGHENPVYVIGSLEGSEIGLSDPKLWEDNKTDEDASAVSEIFLTSGFKVNNGALPYEVFTSDHATWYPNYGSKYEGTYTEQWTNTTWKSVTGMKYNQYVYGIATAGSTAGQKQLYYDSTVGTITTTNTGKPIVIIENGSLHMLAYKENSQKYCKLSDLVYVSGTTRNYEIPQSVAKASDADTFKYVRCGTFNSALTGSYLYSFEKVSNGDGYDYSNEVRLVRTQYTLHYNDNATPNGGGYYNPATPIELPTPTWTGHTFHGWYKAEDLTGDVYTTTPSGNEGNVDYYAKWTMNSYTVSFNMNDHGTAPENQAVSYGCTVDIPNPEPTADGYTFSGWYTDKDCTDGKEYNFATPVTENLTLYAKWTLNTYVVSFNMNGHGTAPESQTVNHDSTAVKPNDPTADGYTFGGWYTTADCKDAEKFDFGTEITASIVLYAKWVADRTVSFNANGHGGSTIPEAQTVPYNSPIAEPNPAPSETGWSFGGWYTEPECTNKYNFSTPVTENMALYAKWEPITYKVSFNMNGHGNLIPAQMVDYNGKAEKPADPVANGYTFGGWYTDAELKTKYDFSEVVTGDMTLYAKWTRNASAVGTGDSNPILLWIGLAVVGIVSIALSLIPLVKRRREKYDR